MKAILIGVLAFGAVAAGILGFGFREYHAQRRREAQSNTAWQRLGSELKAQADEQELQSVDLVMGNIDLERQGYGKKPTAAELKADLDALLSAKSQIPGGVVTPRLDADIAWCRRRLKLSR